jgi:hypothetical protein
MDLPIYQRPVFMFVQMFGNIMNFHGPQQQSVHTILPFRAVSGNIQFCGAAYAFLCFRFAVFLNPITI